MTLSAAARPPVYPAGPWAFPVPTRHTLDNGMDVLAYDVPGQHVISMRLALPAPLSVEPPAREGVGTIMARTIEEGTRRRSAQEMTELLERRGVALTAGVGEWGAVVHVDVPRRTFAPAIELLAEVLSEPAFAEAEVRREVRARLAEIDQQRATPSYRAALEFQRTFYHPDNRWSRPSAGYSETVATIEPADVATYHAAVVRPESATMVVAGHLEGLDVPAEFARGLSPWAADRHAPIRDQTGRNSTAQAPDRARIVVVDRPGSVQSELYVGCPGPDRRVPDGWAPYPVLSFLLGGGPQARLDAVLREEKGYTYGIRCLFRPRAEGGLFVISGAVRSEVTAPALAILIDILNEARDGFSEAETQSGIDFVSKTAPSRYATADAIADEAAARVLDRGSTEDVTRSLQEMATLTPSQLQQAYRRFVNGAWTIVVVGSAEQIVADLEGSGLGPVTVVPA